MNAVQKIKERHTQKEAREMDALLIALQASMEKNTKHRRDAEYRARNIESSRAALVNIALYRAGIPFDVL